MPRQYHTTHPLKDLTSLQAFRQFFLPLLPVIFAGYIGALSFYVHVHVVDGEAVLHSHPFRNLPGQPFHGHTTADFWLLSIKMYICNFKKRGEDKHGKNTGNSQQDSRSIRRQQRSSDRLFTVTRPLISGWFTMSLLIV